MTGAGRLMLAACLALSGCESQCVLNDDLRLFAGDGARDCGSATAAGDRSNVDACVAQAFEAGEAFMARYEHQGISSKTVTAVASNSDGRIKIFQWDSAPCGGSGCAAANFRTIDAPKEFPTTCAGATC